MDGEPCVGICPILLVFSVPLLLLIEPSEPAGKLVSLEQALELHLVPLLLGVEWTLDCLAVHVDALESR